jgi:ATP-dependent RNA helicase SUPV3L1/SUV3
MPLPSISRATLDVPFEVMAELASLLPPDTTFSELLEHVASLALLPPHTTLGSVQHKLPLADVVEPLRDHLSLSEFDLFTYSPVNLRDPNSVQIFTSIVTAFAKTGKVSVDEVFRPSRLIRTLEMVEGTLSMLPPLPPHAGIGKRLLVPPILISSIPLLETMHKSLVLYIWLSFRLSVAFPDRPRAVDLKSRTEVVLEACLERLPGLRNKKTSERGKAIDREVRDWRRENVSPNGTKKEPGQPRKGIQWRNKYEALKRAEVWRNVGVVQERA